MGKALFLILILLVIIICLAIYFWPKVEKLKPEEKEMSIKDLLNKRVVMIVANENFRDAEYLVPKEIFEGISKKYKNSN